MVFAIEKIEFAEIIYEIVYRDGGASLPQPPRLNVCTSDEIRKGLYNDEVIRQYIEGAFEIEGEYICTVKRARRWLPPCRLAAEVLPQVVEH